MLVLTVLLAFPVSCYLNQFLAQQTWALPMHQWKTPQAESQAEPVARPAGPWDSSLQVLPTGGISVHAAAREALRRDVLHQQLEIWPRISVAEACKAGDSLAQSNAPVKQRLGSLALTPEMVFLPNPFPSWCSELVKEPSLGGRASKLMSDITRVLCTLAGWPHRVTTEENCTHVGMHSGVQSLLSQQVVLCQWFNLF